MNLTTNWGYSLTTCDGGLPDIITATEFNSMTANKYSGDSRVDAAVKSASSAVRNYCGWHLYPSANCTMAERVLYGNGRIKTVGNDIMVQLPSRFVSAVSSVKIGEITCKDFSFDTDGILHIFDVGRCLNKKTQITVDYTAGLPASLVQSIKGIVVNRVTHALSSTNGIASESAGGVSISYNSNWLNSSSSSALADNDKETLSFYRLQGVF